MISFDTAGRNNLHDYYHIEFDCKDCECQKLLELCLLNLNCVYDCFYVFAKKFSYALIC